MIRYFQESASNSNFYLLGIFHSFFHRFRESELKEKKGGQNKSTNLEWIARANLKFHSIWRENYLKNIIKIYKSVSCPSRLRRRKGIATLVLCVQPIRSSRQGGGSVSFDRSTVILSPCLLHHSPRKTRPSRARARFSPGNHHSNCFRKPHPPNPPHLYITSYMQYPPYIIHSSISHV